jgi:hypothetical protein
MTVSHLIARAVKRRSTLAAARVCMACLASFNLVSCSGQPENTTNQSSANPAQASVTFDNETFNERVARQKRCIPGITSCLLPAPEGDAREVASAAIREAGQTCAKVTEAERFDSDGSIIAKCGDRDFRIFKMEGSATPFSLDCKAGRDILGVDPCDRKVASNRAVD